MAPDVVAVNNFAFMKKWTHVGKGDQYHMSKAEAEETAKYRDLIRDD